MKRIAVIIISAATAALLVSCNKVRRSPGRVYMPDMNYSRAYETYSSTEELKKKYPTIQYNSMPVAGTMAKGDMTWEYPFKNDSLGYIQSSSVENPLNKETIDMKNAERLYLIYCGICHGTKLDGNGPLWKDGNGPFPNAPKNLMGDDMVALKEGTMFHSVTYGKNTMGSYASQLSTEQRWMVIEYIKKKQAGATAKAATPAADSTKTK